MALWNRNKDGKKNISEDERERRDRASVTALSAGGSRRRKDIVDGWKNMVKGQGKDWIERLVFLLAEDIKSGGMKVPTSTDQALDGSAAVIDMATASADAVQNMANKQIAQSQAQALQYQQYLDDLDDQIAAAEKRISDIRAEGAREKVKLATTRKQYEDYLVEISVRIDDKLKEEGSPAVTDDVKVPSGDIVHPEPDIKEPPTPRTPLKPYDRRT